MRRVWPYVFLIALTILLYDYSRQTREDIKVEYGHKNIDEPYRVQLENYSNRYICNDCGMMIKKYKHSAQVVTAQGKVYFFDDVGCMIRWLRGKKFKGNVKKYVFTIDTKIYLDAELAWYVRDEPTPLGYGFGAYETSIGAIQSAFRRTEIEDSFGAYRGRKENKEIYEYEEVERFSKRGETLLHPMIKRQILIKKD